MIVKSMTYYVVELIALPDYNYDKNKGRDKDMKSLKVLEFLLDEREKVKEEKLLKSIDLEIDKCWNKFLKEIKDNGKTGLEGVVEAKRLMEEHTPGLEEKLLKNIEDRDCGELLMSKMTEKCDPEMLEKFKSLIGM